MKMSDIFTPAAGKQWILSAAGFLFFIIALNPAFAANRVADPGRPVSVPFSVGEKIAYRVSWEMIPAGDVTFTVMDHADFKGEKSWHFVLEGRSKRFVDFFYKVRDRLDSYTDLDFSRSLQYKKLQTGKEDKNVVVYFNWDKKTATYSNNGGKRPPIEIPDFTFDPLASFYKLRTLNLNVSSQASQKGDDLFFSVTDGKKCFMQRGEIIKKEKITLSTKSYDTYLIIPYADHFSGVFKKSKDATVKVWLSADKRQIPVRIAIKVFIGSIIFELINDG